jgi:hypothetical protein
LSDAVDRFFEELWGADGLTWAEIERCDRALRSIRAAREVGCCD